MKSRGQHGSASAHSFSSSRATRVLIPKRVTPSESMALMVSRFWMPPEALIPQVPWTTALIIRMCFERSCLSRPTGPGLTNAAPASTTDSLARCTRATGAFLRDDRFFAPSAPLAAVGMRRDPPTRRTQGSQYATKPVLIRRREDSGLRYTLRDQCSAVCIHQCAATTLH
jgi:hypothetical protein